MLKKILNFFLKKSPRYIWLSVSHKPEQRDTLTYKDLKTGEVITKDIGQPCCISRQDADWFIKNLNYKDTKGSL